MDLIEKLLHLLAGYPTYIKGMVGVWIILGAALIGLLIIAPRKEHPDNVLFVSDINELWSPLLNDIKSVENPEHKKLVVIGLTLYAAWNQLRPWIVDSDTKGWTIELYCLSPKTARDSFSNLLEPKWAIDASERLEEINEFNQAYKANLQARHMKLTVKTYNSFPAIHGFLLGTGKIYMSYTQWSEQSHLLDYGPHPYEVIEPDEKGVRAEAYRKLYYNWLERVQQQ